MKTSRTTHHRARRKRALPRKKSHFVLHQQSYRFVAFFILAAALLFTISTFVLHSSRGIVKNLSVPSASKIALLQLIPTVVPTITPTPTASPTAAPVYTGYCLTVPVLFYHHIQPAAEAKAKGQTSLSVDNGIFDQQMAYLTTHGYTTIHTNQLTNALRTHTPLVPKSIVVSFDDGYKDNFTYAYPVWQKYHVNVDMMLATGLIGESDYMGWDNVEDMGRSGLVYFTDHTWSHYSVGKGSLEKIKFEIDTAKQQIEQHTGQKVDVFTYPYGTTSTTAISYLQEAGFSGAFTTQPGQVQCDSFIMALHRTRVGNTSLSAYGI